MGRSFESVRMGVKEVFDGARMGAKEVSEKWLKASRVLTIFLKIDRRVFESL